VSLEIRNTKKDKAQPINVIVYGESGIGKTSLVKSLPNKEVLILSAEGGLLSLTDKEDMDGYDYVVVKSIVDVMKVLKQIEGLEYKTVAIDSITELSQNHFTYLKKKYEVIAKEADKDVSAYGIKIWGDFLEDFSAMFKTLRDMRKNVLAIGLLREKEDETGMKFKQPDIYGKTAERIVAWFDECFYMYMSKENVRMFLTEKVNNIVAKDRSGKLEKTEPAIISDIFAKIRK